MRNVRIYIFLRMRKVSAGLLIFNHILYYPVLLLADSEGPDHTDWMCMLIWAFAVRICSKAFFVSVIKLFFIKQDILFKKTKRLDTAAGLFIIARNTVDHLVLVNSWFVRLATSRISILFSSISYNY